MIDFSDISVIFHCRIDNEERAKNASLVYKFYKTNTVNSEIIFIEDDTDSKLTSHLSIEDIDQHIIFENNGNWQKTKSYNRGANKSNRSYFCFLDLDIIVHPRYIVEAVDQINTNKDMGLVLGYNGQSLYLTYEAKRLFELTPTYENLECFIPREWLNQGTLLNDNIRVIQDFRTSQTGSALNEYKYCIAPNSKAVGGCVITSKEKFFEYGGFNPNFVGWGYEDNELPSRVHRLGYDVTRINCPEALLFHLPHDPVGGVTGKNADKDHNRNHKEITKVENSTKEELQEYIKTWNV
tara:strand:+ start:492 stop:1376 length:885 start_codon:yes stop_codon:yes gene_type:complete